jgi:hypothetical protein
MAHPDPAVLADACEHELHALGSLFNRALLVNNLFAARWLPDGDQVVSAVGMKPPDDECSKVRPPKVLHAVRVGHNEPTASSVRLS